jgi:hypothetical protein
MAIKVIAELSYPFTFIVYCFSAECLYLSLMYLANLILILILKLMPILVYSDPTITILRYQYKKVITK